jgi:uncharacterized delta-60 repeat protein
MKIFPSQSLKTSRVFASRLIRTFFVLLIFVYAGFAAGSLDAAFNVSVTDGVGFVESTIIQPDGKIIAFGYFQRAGNERLGSIARLNRDGTPDTTFKTSAGGANGAISAARLLPDGKILIGGSFTSYDGVSRNRLARINADGSLDATFNSTANFNNTITDLLIQPDGKIIACGRFNAPPGQTLASRIVRLNADGTIDSTFFNNAVTNGDILSMAYQPDGKILIGGEFREIAGVPVFGIARLNGDGSRDASFTGSADGVNKIIVLPDGKILICGAAGSVVQRLKTDGTVEANFDGINFVVMPYVLGIAVQADGKVIAGVGYNSNTNISILRLNEDLTVDSSFPVKIAKSSVRDFTIQADGKILFGGDFLTFDDQTRMRLGRLNADGSNDAAFNPSISSVGLVRAIKRQPDGRILIAGMFQTVNGVRRTNIARLNADGSLDDTFNAPVEPFDYLYSYVFDLKLQADGKILIGKLGLLESNLARTDSLTVNSKGGLIRLNPDGSLDEGFTPSYMLRVVAINIEPDNKILISGYFEDTNQLGFFGYRKLNQNGTFDAAYNPSQPPFASIKEIITQPDGKTLVGGTFTNANGFPHAGTARYNADGTLDANYSGNISNVHALAMANDGRIYVGGEFGIGGNNPNRNFTRLNPSGLVDSSFNTGAGANALVRDIFVQTDGRILIGGDFTSYNGATASRIARVNADGSLDSTFNAGASGSVYALDRQPDGKILVGGEFLDFNGVQKFSLVRLQDAGTVNRTPFDFDGDGKSDVSVFRPSDSVWYLQQSTNGFSAYKWGISSDKITPADFDGDGKTDIAVFRNGVWYITRSSDNTVVITQFGQFGDTPRPADFDGDGRADYAVFRPGDMSWFILQSRDGYKTVQFGLFEDKPLVADFDGDGRADINVFRPANGNWYWLNSSNGQSGAVNFGLNGDLPVAGDYDGDGKTDFAVFRPSTNIWYRLNSSNGQFSAVQWGTNGDIPAAGDYDGDGKTDLAVFRPSSGVWYLLNSLQGFRAVQFGLQNDRPTANAFVQ